MSFRPYLKTDYHLGLAFVDYCYDLSGLFQLFDRISIDKWFLIIDYIILSDSTINLDPSSLIFIDKWKIKFLKHSSVADLLFGLMMTMSSVVGYCRLFKRGFDPKLSSPYKDKASHFLYLSCDCFEILNCKDNKRNKLRLQMSIAYFQFSHIHFENNNRALFHFDSRLSSNEMEYVKFGRYHSTDEYDRSCLYLIENKDKVKYNFSSVIHRSCSYSLRIVELVCSFFV